VVGGWLGLEEKIGREKLGPGGGRGWRREKIE